MTTTTTTTTNPPQTLHSSLIGKTTAQQEALCEEDSTLLGCDGVLATKRQRELEQQQAEMAKLKLPFGGKISFSRTAVGGSETTLTGMLGSEAIRQAGLEAKPSKTIKNDGSRENDKYSAGAVFLTSSTGTARTNAMVYGVHAGNVDRRPGGLVETEEENRYNIATKFTPTASGKYSIEVFHARKDKGKQTRLDHGLVGGKYSRNASLVTDINTEWNQAGTVTSLGKLSPTGKDAYMEIGSLALKEHLGLKADDMMFDKWSYKILSGKSKLLPSGETEDGRFYAEVWDNYGVDSKDYMVGGVWLLMPEGGSKSITDGRSMTRFATFAQTNSSYAGTTISNGGVGSEVEGTATYHGLAAGFYVDDMDQVHRLLGKVQMNADFGTSITNGTLGGSITGITLNGQGNKGTLVLLPQALHSPVQVVSAPWDSKDATVAGSINGVAMTGDWSGLFTGPATVTDNPKPTGVIGTASGYSADEKHIFAVSFGAKPPAKK